VKDKERARVSSAIDDLPFDAAHKALIKQVAEFGGPQAAASAVNSLIKPVNETNEVKNYMYAKQNGYTKSFVDYQQDTNPNKFLTKGAAGSQIFSAADLLHGSQGGAPTEQGPQLAELVSQNFPGAKITSTLRTPAQNAAVGGVPNSEHMVPDGAIDFVLGSPAEMQEAAAKINSAGAGFKAIYEGPGAANSTGPHVHIERVGGAPAGAPSGAPSPAKPLAVIPPNVRAAATAWSLTPEETNAINTAVGAGKLDLKGLNSRTAKIAADAFIANPNLDAVHLHAIAQGTSNPLTQRNIMNLSAIPEMVQNIAGAGKALNYSKVQFIGKMQQWGKGQLNDPAFTNYMTQRKDGLMQLAGAFRGAAATDIGTKLEEEAQRPTLDPAALDGWVKGQMISALPKLERAVAYDATGEARKAIDIIRAATAGAKLSPKDTRSAADAILKGG